MCSSSTRAASRTQEWTSTLTASGLVLRRRPAYRAPPGISCLFLRELERRLPARLAGFGKRRAALAVPLAMMPTARPARAHAPSCPTAEAGVRRSRDATIPHHQRRHVLDDLSLAAPGAVALRRLANLLARYTPHDGVFPLRLPGTYALRRARMTSEPVHATLGPSLCIVAQGAKVVMLGSDVLEYDPARMLVFAVDLPVSGQVTRASRRDPFLGFKLDLDPARVAELAARVYPRGVPKPSDNRGLYVGQRDRRHHRRRHAPARSDGAARRMRISSDRSSSTRS